MPRTTQSAQEEIFQKYFHDLRQRYVQGNYTEMTFRTPFENFITNLNSEYSLFQEPERKQRLGAPDFRAFRNAGKVGYIETKDLGVNLDNEMKSEQMTKYKEGIENIVFTDYARFILIRNGEPTNFDFNLFNLEDLSKNKFRVDEQKIDEFLRMINAFFDYNQPTITTAEELASDLSKKAKLLRDLAIEQLEEDITTLENNSGESQSSVYDFFQGIKELINDITVSSCADAFAQTITYGLFLARINKNGRLERETASLSIPQSVGIIRKIFSNISGNLPSNLSWIIDEIVEVLNASDMDKVLTQIDSRNRKDRDPFTFFYEDFLAEYDPEKRKHLGVYFTPRPVVSFIVNSVDIILRNEFGKANGFADDEVTVLDPAVGTGTFLWMVYLISLVTLKNKGLSGLISKKIENHLLKDFFGFEILITPYIFSHLKLSSTLSQWHYQLKDKDRVEVFLTNTLEPSESHGLIPFMRELNEESKVASEIKQKKKILAIVSNPPYSGTSFNKSKWIQDLLKVGYTSSDGRKDLGYFSIDGKPLAEKNPKWLQDDYVKFIRFAQWKIDTSGDGVIGFITNHAYLDNPTFRGMRRSLLNSFDRIYILNLHGSSQKKEKAPDGSKDENVFDIMQGVSIAIFIKNSKFKEKKVFYADLFGTRENKFSWLDKNRVNTVKWQEIVPTSPHYVLVQRNTAYESEYQAFSSVTEIFDSSTVGIITARDDLAIGWTPDDLWKTVTNFARMDKELARKKYNLGEDSDDWKVSWAQDDLLDSGLKKEYLTPISFRPFDTRFTYYTGKTHGFLCRPRPEIMKSMLKDNLGLVTVRQVAEGIFNHVLVSNTLIDGRLTLSNKGIAYLFPLYKYENGDKKPNINSDILSRLSSKFGRTVQSEEFFYYVYAVLHSRIYREKFAEFLKMDFPRIPLAHDYSTFSELSEIGKQLVELHLQKKTLETHTKFESEGENTVNFVKYSGNQISINDIQSFQGIPSEVWEFQMGGYHVLDKWLKSRKNKQLDSSEIEAFLQMVEIIKKTINLMNKIDETGFVQG